jgi:hypothetical protein
LCKLTTMGHLIQHEAQKTGPLREVAGRRYDVENRGEETHFTAGPVPGGIVRASLGPLLKVVLRPLSGHEYLLVNTFFIIKLRVIERKYLKLSNTDHQQWLCVIVCRVCGGEE